jgi:heme-degrading monooxygenase HmoA
MMWLNSSRTTVNPEDMAKVVEILSSEASLAPIRSAPGFCGLLFVESTETPGEILSLTWWQSAEEGQAYLASPECRGVIESVQEYLVAPLERSYYEMYLEVAPQTSSVNQECG